MGRRCTDVLSASVTAIGGAAIYLLCADGKGREARTQFALTFKADA